MTWEASIAYHLKASISLEVLGPSIEHAALLMNIALACGRQGHGQSQQHFYDQSKEIYESLGLQNTSAYAQLLANMGITHYTQGRVELAKQHLERSKAACLSE